MGESRKSAKEIPVTSYEFDVTPGFDHEPLSVRWGGQEVLIQKIPIETRSVPYILLKYCFSGAGVLETENQRWEIGPKMVFWSSVRSANTLTAVRHTQMVNQAIALGGREAVSDVERFLQAPVGVIELTDPDPIETIMQELMDEGRGTAEHRDEVCALLAKVLLRRIHAQAASPNHANALARQTFKRCREHIERNFAKLTMLGEVADACEVTVPYLCRLFDQFFSCSPYEYLTRLKMSRAENLLLGPTTPVRDVATAVGYKDARLFARNFKVTYGKNPTEYRQASAGPDESDVSGK